MSVSIRQQEGLEEQLYQVTRLHRYDWRHGDDSRHFINSDF
jgi:hypothetical protein